MPAALPNRHPGYRLNMAAGTFKDVQFAFAAHLRDPERQPAPADVEDRRLAIYRDLIYNNIEGFISSGFPVLREITNDDRWHAMVRDFIRRHECHTPYFLEIGQEFLAYLQQERQAEGDPPFMLELAHYEWVELALDVSTEIIPPAREAGDLLEWTPQVSPLAWNLSYQFPVHRIGSDWQPSEPPEQPTFLVVHRNRRDEVRFMESNAATSRLLALISGNDVSGEEQITGRKALERLAREMQAPDPRAVLDFGRDLLNKLRASDILI